MLALLSLSVADRRAPSTGRGGQANDMALAMRLAREGEPRAAHGVYYIDTLLFWAGSEVAHVTGAAFDNFLWNTVRLG
jgi:hypothetical protein